MAEHYPLDWPEGWPRTEQRYRKWSLPGGRVNHGWDATNKRLQKELQLLGAKHIVLSTDMPLRRDGQPYARKPPARLEDPGAAIYFELNGKALAMAQDEYELLVDNIRSLALAIEHLRGLHRHGGGTMMERAFVGFEALPAPEDEHGDEPWWEVIGVPPDAPHEAVKATYRSLLNHVHPDKGGDEAEFIRINNAWLQYQERNG